MRNRLIYLSIVIGFFGCKTTPNNNEMGKEKALNAEDAKTIDLREDYFKNPVLAGDYADPSILRVGDSYYMTHSSFDYAPGLKIWHSVDLVNWKPAGYALGNYIGTVWAPDFIKYNGKYYIYFPVHREGTIKTMVVVADSPSGKWSEPVDVGIDGLIDPGHIVGEDGKRYLFFSDGWMTAITDDGLKTTGERKKVYEGWKYPADWVVEGFCLEAPKLMKVDEYFYLTVAQGGTAGPPTSHMVVTARSKSVFGPWKNAPNNPVIRTQSRDEKWWSVGHGTFIETPDKKWYLVYHGYENGYYNLGRQTLIEPVEWTTDGWIKAVNGIKRDEQQPMPVKSSVQISNLSFSDDFSTNRLGFQWQFYKGTDISRFQIQNKTLVLKAQGDSPTNSGPLTFITGDHSYEMVVEAEVRKDASAGIIVFYNPSRYCGLGFKENKIIVEENGFSREISTFKGSKAFLKLKNNRHIVTLEYSMDGENWQFADKGFEVSSYHHNALGDFQSLRPALFASGRGEARFRNFAYSGNRE